MNDNQSRNSLAYDRGRTAVRFTRGFLYPFNDVLSEQTEKILTGMNNDTPFSFKIFWRDTVRTLISEGEKIAVFVAGMLLLLLLHLLPILGTALYPVLSMAWTALFLVLEYNGYVFTRKWKIRGHNSYLICKAVEGF